MWQNSLRTANVDAVRRDVANRRLSAFGILDRKSRIFNRGNRNDSFRPRSGRSCYPAQISALGANADVSIGVMLDRSREPNYNTSMKKLLFQSMIAILSSGWIIPLVLSFWASYDFLFEVLWVKKGEYQGSWHPVSSADNFFYFGMAWLFVVVFVWSFRLSGQTKQDEKNHHR